MKSKSKIMKRTIYLILAFMAFLMIACNNQKEKVLTIEEKSIVENEISIATADLFKAFESLDANKAYSFILQNEDFAEASMGKLITDHRAILDTMKLHLGSFQKERISITNQKIYVINMDAAVISLASMGEITFKNGAEMKAPFALTILWVKKDGEWKVAHYHN
jgi:ketosteroid isomerase-like protein